MNDAERVAMLQDGFWLAGEALMFRHTNPWELDEALTDWGYEMGPCEAQDLFGLEKVLARLPVRPVPILGRMVAEGRMGKSGGVGYYRYPGGGGAVIDPLIEDLILEEAWFGKVARSEISKEEIVARMNAALAKICNAWLTEGMPRDRLSALLGRAVHLPMDKDLATLGLC